MRIKDKTSKKMTELTLLIPGSALHLPHYSLKVNEMKSDEAVTLCSALLKK